MNSYQMGALSGFEAFSRLAVVQYVQRGCSALDSRTHLVALDCSEQLLPSPWACSLFMGPAPAAPSVRMSAAGRSHPLRRHERGNRRSVPLRRAGHRIGLYLRPGYCRLERPALCGGRAALRRWRFLALRIQIRAAALSYRTSCLGSLRANDLQPSGPGTLAVTGRRSVLHGVQRRPDGLGCPGPLPFVRPGSGGVRQAVCSRRQHAPHSPGRRGGRSGCRGAVPSLYAHGRIWTQCAIPDPVVHTVTAGGHPIPRFRKRGDQPCRDLFIAWTCSTILYGAVTRRLLQSPGVPRPLVQSRCKGLISPPRRKVAMPKFSIVIPMYNRERLVAGRSRVAWPRPVPILR